MMLKEAMDRFLDEISKGKSPQAHARDQRLVRMFLQRFGDMPLEEVTPLALSHYRDRRMKEAGASTVAKDLIMLKEVFQAAMLHWGIPLEGNPVNTLSDSDPGPARAWRLTQGDRTRLLAACDGYPNATLGLVVRIVLETGLRKNEILALKLGDVDLTQRVVRVSRIGLNAPREVPLTRTATTLFKHALSLEERPGDTEWIFYGEPSRFGDRKPYAIDRVFRQILTKAHLKRIRFDDLRTEAMSAMAEAGLSEGEVVAITGSRRLKISRKAPEYQLDRLLQRLDALWPEVLLPVMGKPEGLEVEETMAEEVEKKNPRSPSRRTGGAFGAPRRF